VFAVETVPEHFDQRADSAEKCIQMLSQGGRPTVRCARVYVLYGELSPLDIEAVKAYLIDPAVSMETSLELPESLGMKHEEPAPTAILIGFTTMVERNLPGCIEKMGLEMDEADLAMCVDHFRDEEERDPTITELRLIDRCWSERCRHTTLNTIIDSVVFEDPLLEKAYRDYLAVRKAIRRAKPVTLTDIATMAVRELKLMGRLDKLDESGECDACTIKINVEVI
jgi:phosphoribosylformylglycinamidine synthase